MLRIERLRVSISGRPVLQGVSADVARGEMLALVGESGSGKTTAALAIPRLLPRGAEVEGHIWLDGTDLLAESDASMRRLRGDAIGIMVQDSLAALNPVRRIGDQLIETIRVHRRVTRTDARERAVSLLEEVGLEDAANRLRAYPHQLSGGMRQRVCMAMALACDPALLIADEPTTGLDEASAAQIMALLTQESRARQLAVLFVTHDLSLVVGHADRVLVLDRGMVIESGTPRQLLDAPRAPVTRALLGAVTVPGPPPLPRGKPALQVRKLWVRYPGQSLAALRDVSFTLQAGECLGVVGPSGAGKTTLGRAIAQMVPHEGEVDLHGTVLERQSGAERRRALRRIQMVFQDPSQSLNPDMSVGRLVAEPMDVAGMNRAAQMDRAETLLKAVGLSADLLRRFPGTLSGGQAQRVAIARALAADSEVLILDEPTSRLDAVTQSGILDLMRRLAAERGLIYVFITHDLAVCRAVAHRVATVEKGRIALSQVAVPAE